MPSLMFAFLVTMYESIPAINPLTMQNRDDFIGKSSSAIHHEL